MLLTALLVPILALAAPVERDNATSTGTGGGSTDAQGGAAAPAALLSAETRAYLDTALKRWNIPGAAIVAVASPMLTKKTGDEGWLTEYYSYGVANAAGDKVTEDVRPSDACG
jgi:hypothetical protein